MPFSTTPLFGMTIRESADDGSDFTNPGADYRRLFLGEDGQLHVKDSSGTVTTVGSGAPTTLDYLVGTATGSLSAEIVVGTTPGGELGGTWGTPTVDIVHAGATVWTDYTPTWTATTTNPTLGSTTCTGRFKKLDTNTGLVNINVAITTGGAWNAGSGSYIFSLPAGWTTHATRIQVGAAHILDSGTAHYSGTCKSVGGSTQISETVIGDAAGNRLLSNNVPVTWATGDQINLSIMLEIQ